MKTRSVLPAFFLSSVVMLLSGIERGWSQSNDWSTTYTITGIANNDVLNVRSGPGMNFSIVAKLAKGDGGVSITGESVVNGDDDWVPISFPGGKGWTRPKYLTQVDTPTALTDLENSYASPDPEGRYWLAPQKAEHPGSSPLEICLESRNVREKEGESICTGDFTITVTDGKQVIESYQMSSLLTDGSGSHADFLFAASADTLRKIENTDAYARGSSDSPTDVIYYILFDPEIKGGMPLKSGDKAGYVTIHGLKRALFKMSDDVDDACKSRLGFEAVGIDDPAEEATMKTVITRNGKLLATVEGSRPVSFSPDGRILLLAEAAPDDDCRHFLLNIAAGEYQKDWEKWRQWKIGSRYHSKANWSADSKTVTLKAEDDSNVPMETYDVVKYCRPNAPDR